MKTMIQIIFTSILLAVAPTFAHAAYLQSHLPYQQDVRQTGVAYFVDQTKTWALESRAEDVMNKVTRDKAAKPQVSTLEFYGTGNTSVPGISVYKDDSRTPKSR
jgi:hypothetical protein